MNIKNLLKLFIPKRILRLISHLRNMPDLVNKTRPVYKRHCPLCDYHGFFNDFGHPTIRLDARCPNCGSLERHRLFWLWYGDNASKLAEPILHFAPETILENEFRKNFVDYKTADLFNDADLKLNIENIELQSKSIKTVICNHVLEHVNDKKALSEINRILTDDGILIASVPIIEGWDKTYENPEITDPFMRTLYFGQEDHVRYYGKDFRDRLSDAGFKFEEITAEGDDVIKYGLMRGEKFFICHRA